MGAREEEAIDPRLLSILECPRCRSALDIHTNRLTCAAGHEYPVADGVPVFLLPEEEATIGIAANSYAAARSGEGGPLYTDTLGISAAEKEGVLRQYESNRRADGVDPVISYLVGATCGFGYGGLIGKTAAYPIPVIPLAPGGGKLLLDIGCNWGRWSIAAARNGWRAVGIDPSLGAIMAARRAFKNESNALFVCGDARFLPFKAEAFSCAFSYSVIQHFSEADAVTTIREVGRVLKHDGVAKIQLANRGGLRSTFIRHSAKFADGGHFRVRYWPLSQMKDVFSKNIGATTLLSEAFGGLGLLYEDRKIVSSRAKLLIFASTLGRAVARVVTPLIHLADSVYVIAVKR